MKHTTLPEKNEERLSGYDPVRSLWLGMILLFFFQLFGVWMESIYRISLTALAPGMELLGLLLFLVALPLLWLPPQSTPRLFRAAVLLFLLCRFCAPLLGTMGGILFGGVGVSLFLVLLACLLSRPYARLSPDFGKALGVAVLLSVVLRSWGLSLDISMDGMALSLGAVLTGMALLLSWHDLNAPLQEQEAVEDADMGSGAAFVPMCSFFAALGIAFLFLSSPLAVNGWHGYSRPFFTGTLFSGAVVVPIVLFMLVGQRIPNPGRYSLPVGNFIFTTLLVVALYAGRPPFPETALSVPIVLSSGVLPGKSGVWMALLMSPVILLNLRKSGAYFSVRPFAHPRCAVAPLIVAALFLVSISILLILTNVWGYVPGGQVLRNQFYLPFFILGVFLMIFGFVKAPDKAALPRRGTRLMGSLSLILLLLWLASLWHTQRPVMEASRGDTLRVVSYNMQQGSNTAGVRDYLGQRSLLRCLNADVIALQECDTARVSGALVDAVYYFSQSLGYHAFYGPGSISGTFGTALLSRYPSENPRVLFSFSNPDEVGTAAAEIELSGQPIAVFSNHPAGDAEIKNAHLDSLVKEASRYQYAIAMGDFNFTERDPFYGQLMDFFSQVAARSGSNPLWMKRGIAIDDAIDHIFLSAPFTVLENDYVLPPQSRSDHPLHWAQLQLKGSEAP